MNAVTQDWADNAEGDWDVVSQLLRVRKRPNYDAVCFHAQQSAEKYLKARLSEANVVFPRTHDLLALLALALPVEPTWTALRPALGRLAFYSVDIRYPGLTADRDEAKEARRLCALVRKTIRPSLGLPI